MGNGHGTLRSEIRFDHVTEGKDKVISMDVIVLQEVNVVQVKLGFDLWDK